MSLTILMTEAPEAIRFRTSVRASAASLVGRCHTANPYVNVHVDQAGQHRFAVCPDLQRTGRNLDAADLADSGDPLATNENGGAFDRRPTGAIDQCRPEDRKILRAVSGWQVLGAIEHWLPPAERELQDRPIEAQRRRDDGACGY